MGRKWALGVGYGGVGDLREDTGGRYGGIWGGNTGGLRGIWGGMGGIWGHVGIWEGI